jgi:hypothetical protein
MNISKAELPSNKKFGFFFSFIFLLCATYFFYNNQQSATMIFSSLALILICTSILRAELLLPLNRLWMGLGMILGMIVSPIVLAILFFFMFTPIAIIARIFKRDELALEPTNSVSFWKQRVQNSPNAKSFMQQF